MKIVQGDELEWKRALEYRGGTFHNRRMVEGTPGTVDNFQTGMGVSDKDFVSPRHRHNFDQYRFQLEGELDFARDGCMTPGTVGFYPEGCYYGPQTSSADATNIVLQFGGSSGGGFLSGKEVRDSMEELKKFGRFEAGVYKRNPGVPGKRNLDGYQAIWEHVFKRPMKYPKSRYPKPIIMDPTNYDWVPVSGQPGVDEKLLGVFTERRTYARFFRIAPRATLRMEGRGIYIGYRGTGRVQEEPLRMYTTTFLDWGEQAQMIAETEIQVLNLGLPDLRGMKLPNEDYLAAAA